MKFVCGCLLIGVLLLVSLAAAGTVWALPLALVALVVGVVAVMESLA